LGSGASTVKLPKAWNAPRQHCPNQAMAERIAEMLNSREELA
jgi:hypothetical protein